MANDLLKNPWILDTADANNVLFDGPWRGKILWVVEGGSDGNSVVLKDKNDRKIWEQHHDGSIDNYTSDGVLPSHTQSFQGLKLTTRDAGTVYIYYE